MTKPDYHHGDLRAALLDAAEAELILNADTNLSIRALAGKLGVSATAPHAHFKTKDDLLTALAVRGFTYLRERTIEGSSNDDDPFNRLRALAHAYMAFAVEKKGLFRLMFSREVAPQNNQDLFEASRSSYAVLRAAIADAYQSAPEQEKGERALTAWALVHGFASLLNEGRIGEDLAADRSPQALADVAAKFFGDGRPD